MSGQVVAVHRSARHAFSKETASQVHLLEGLGVEGDAHAGTTVQHRSRVRFTPAQPNLRQVHLIHAELLDDLAASGHPVAPGELGENVTTRGIDLLGLPVGTRLQPGGGGRGRGDRAAQPVQADRVLPPRAARARRAAAGGRRDALWHVMHVRNAFPGV